MEMTLHFTFIYIDKKINQFLNIRRTTCKSFAYHSLGNADVDDKAPDVQFDVQLTSHSIDESIGIFN